MNNDLISRAAFDEVLDQIEGLKAHAAFTEGIMVARRELASAPAVDAEPVRHGRWRKINVPKRWNGPIIRCSECNTGGTRAWDYCPNCGAKMDGGAQNVNANG